METLFFRNGRLVALAILMIIAVGASSLFSISRQEDPTITNIFATIVTHYPGADPARVESLVTEKIEEELKGIPEIKVVESASRTGISVVQVELKWDTAKSRIEELWSEIRDALADAALQFPPGVPEPELDDDRVGAFSAISAIQATPGMTASPAVLRRYAEILEDRLQALPGTKQVEVYGARQEEILVEVDPQKLTALGLTVAQVSQAIDSADAKVRAGQIRGTESDLLVEIAGEFKSLERIRAIPIRDGTVGQIIRVSDVANISRAVREPAASLAYSNGRPAVLVAAKMADDGKIDQWMSDIKSLLAEYEASLPSSLSHKLIFDQGEYAVDRLTGVLANLAIGVTLVVVVLFVTIGWRAALIVALILPLASLMSLVGLRAFGIPIHQMSLTGLIVALGLLVDAGIVMTDEIRKRLEAGMTRVLAVRDSVRRLAVPLLSSTITTALAFLPMAMLPGPPGDFVGAIAIAVIIMLAASFVLALTVTPAFAGWYLQEPTTSSSGSRFGRGINLPTLANGFSRSLDLALRFPKLAILGAMILPIIGFGSLPTLKAQFFPGVDRDQFYIQIKLPDGTAMQRTDQFTRKAEKVILAHDTIRNVHWVIGKNAPAFYYNMLADQDGESSFAEALITTASADATEALLPVLQKELDAVLPQARIIVRGLVQGPPVRAPVEIRIVGPNLERLREIGDEVRTVLTQVPEIVSARTQLTGGAPKLVIDISEEKARLASLDLGMVAQQLEASLEGATGGSLLESSEQLPVRLRVGAEDRGSISAMRQFDILAPASQAQLTNGRYPGIPLLALGSVDIRPAMSPIFRRDGERINTVQGYVQRNVLPEEALKTIVARIHEAGIVLPPGYRFEIGGDADARDEVMSGLLSVAGIVGALTLATIVLTFNSFSLAMIGGAVILLSVGLSALALAIFGYPFGIMAVIGLIGSIGVSINAAIIIITALQKEPQAMIGNSEAIRNVVSAQSRHIISTTVTTFGGFLPLILAGGGFWPPFAMAIAGGVLLSTIVSFYFVPPAFAIVVRYGQKRKVTD